MIAYRYKIIGIFCILGVLYHFFSPNICTSRIKSTVQEHKVSDQKKIKKKAALDKLKKLISPDIPATNDDDTLKAEAKLLESQKKAEASADTFGGRLAKMDIPETFRLKDIVIGDPKAPKTLTIYFSYTCPHCREFHLKEFPIFKKKYVDTGKIKVIFKNYLDDLGAYEAALIVRCLCKNSPKRYERLSDLVLKKQKEWLNSKDPAKFLQKIFVDFSEVSESKIKACLKKTDIGAGLMLEQKHAMFDLAIYSMPAFISNNGTVHVGKISLKKLKKLCNLK